MKWRLASTHALLHTHPAWWVRRAARVNDNTPSRAPVQTNICLTPPNKTYRKGISNAGEATQFTETQLFPARTTSNPPDGLCSIHLPGLEGLLRYGNRTLAQALADFVSYIDKRFNAVPRRRAAVLRERASPETSVTIYNLQSTACPSKGPGIVQHKMAPSQQSLQTLSTTTTTSTSPSASSPLTEAQKATAPTIDASQQRLSLPSASRIVLGTIASGAMGFTLGAMQGGQTAQLRFRAEHAHKMPDTTAGWYFYHKSKNYHAMQGGIREGFRMACRTSGWSFAALGLESTVDRLRGTSDVLSTVVATVSVAGMFSLTSTFFGPLLCSPFL